MYIREYETKIGDALQPQLSLSFSQTCQKQLKSTKVAVVGGGLAGLMAARRLGQHGVKVTVFEARDQVGGRVLSNKTFSNGRITEEGAELIGSFHTEWRALAQEYGLAVVSRMDPELYEQAGLDVKLTLDRPLTMDEFFNLEKAMRTRVLEPMARDASQILHPSEPWQEPSLRSEDNRSVANALENRYGVSRNERLWKMIEFKLVNDEVAPLDKMNFLGLLCKVKGGQGIRRFRFEDPADKTTPLMRYWNELEIFRCADGCQTLACKIAKEIQSKEFQKEYGAKATLHLSRAVTHIDLSQTKVPGVVLGSKEVKDQRHERLADGPPVFTHYDYVILAIPPSVWPALLITPLPWHPKNEIGIMGMAPAVKFFSDVKERFWIKKGAAPYGGALTLGQVWDGTDNQTRLVVKKVPNPRGGLLEVKQGTVLSVFAGPILPGGRVPTERGFKDGLSTLYPADYTSNLNKTHFSNWPKEPFIKTGYVSPRIGEIFTIGKKLSEPFHSRLFFAGEHTQMDFFGYMEGALRSGKRAAEQLMLQSCGLRKEPAPASPSPPVRVASSAPIREKTAF